MRTVDLVASSKQFTPFRGRIEVIADDEDEIVEAARRMTEKYDMVITSGGIGPTHDVNLRLFYCLPLTNPLPGHYVLIDSQSL